MNEIKKSAILALLISIPITAVSWFFTWALIHAQNSVQKIAACFLAPALGLISIWQHFHLEDSPYLFLPLVLLVQFVGYFIAIYVGRHLIRTLRGLRA